MKLLSNNTIIARPFLKWAGGKGQLLDEIDKRLPEQLKTGQINTYIEPFVGGGAVFFYAAQKYDSLKHFYLFDINQDLINCYNTVKHDVEPLIAELRSLENQYIKKNSNSRKVLFLTIRDNFNKEKIKNFGVDTAAKMIFLNKTCYNGLYRVNKKNEFNVPFGDYQNPNICDEDNLRIVSEILQKTDILCGDFEKSESYISQNTFVYLDPPYRPISPTASFTSYSKDDFTEKDQVRLAEFCKRIDKKGSLFLLSNSDPKNENPEDNFFENAYQQFHIDTVKATRAINCKSSGRGLIKELIIKNKEVPKWFLMQKFG